MDILKFKPSDPNPPPIPSEVQAVIAAANAGDRSALPALRRALADHPELVDRLGDLAAHVERGLIALVAGQSLVAAEAVTAHLAKMRADLGETTALPLEKLLIKRGVLCWLACHAAEVERGELLQRGASELLKAADKRVDRAHARFLTATKALATVRRLVVPVSSGAPSLALPGVGNRVAAPVIALPHRRQSTVVG